MNIFHSYTKLRLRTDIIRKLNYDFEKKKTIWNKIWILFYPYAVCKPHDKDRKNHLLGYFLKSLTDKVSFSTSQNLPGRFMRYIHEKKYVGYIFNAYELIRQTQRQTTRHILII